MYFSSSLSLFQDSESGESSDVDVTDVKCALALQMSSCHFISTDMNGLFDLVHPGERT